jgi:virginiamycin A acetyltransferase
MAIIKSVLIRIYLYFLRRRQIDSAALRRFFAKNYDIKVGLYSYGCFDRWRMPGPMRVGRYCSIAGTVRSALQNHRLEAITTHPALYERKFGIVQSDMTPAAPLIIEDDVWIGNNVIILPGCKSIGRGAAIGAGSIVTHDVPRYAIVAGNPAKKLKDRFTPDVIAALEQSNWWDLDMAGLRQLAKNRPELVFNPTSEHIRQWLN